jgi:hypothetical protein
MGTANNETEGDGLLALSAMLGLGSSAKLHSYIKGPIRSIGCVRPPRVRHTALEILTKN